MCSNYDYFLFLSSTGWTVIASIAAVLAIIIALFLPYYQRKKSLSNLRKVIKSELQTNIILLNKANSIAQGELEGEPISKMNLMCPMLMAINLNDWNNHRLSIAEKSSEQYLDMKNINTRLYNIKEQATKIVEMKGDSPYVAIIEAEIDSCLLEINKKFSDMNDNK